MNTDNDRSSMSSSVRIGAPSVAEPVFAFLAFTSGSYEGAIIRDMRLANDLHRRGFRVHVYWMMERNPELIDRAIPQRVLARATRYRFRKPSRVADEYVLVFAIVP